MRRGSWCCQPRSHWREGFARRAYSACSHQPKPPKRMLASQTCSSPNISSRHFRLTSTCAAPEIRNAKSGEVRVRQSMFMYVYKRLPEPYQLAKAWKWVLRQDWHYLLRSYSRTFANSENKIPRKTTFKIIGSRIGYTALGQKTAGCHNRLSRRKQTTSQAFIKRSCYCRNLHGSTFVSLGYPRFTRRIEVRIHVSNATTFMDSSSTRLLASQAMRFEWTKELQWESAVHRWVVWGWTWLNIARRRYQAHKRE